MPVDPYILILNFWDKFGQSPYFKFALIGGGVFVFIILLAMVKKHIFEISMKGATFGFFLGLIVMLVLDLILIFGMADKTKLAKLTSGDNRQEAIQEVFISGVSGLGNVLGVTTTSNPKKEKPKIVEEIIHDYLSLPKDDAEKFKTLLCPR